MKVFVDATKCHGHALCLTNAPDGFEFVSVDDRSQVRDGAIGTVPLEEWLTAARECPERAIVVELDD